jgi:hypothetical protein
LIDVDVRKSWLISCMSCWFERVYGYDLERHGGCKVQTEYKSLMRGRERAWKEKARCEESVLESQSRRIQPDLRVVVRTCRRLSLKERRCCFSLTSKSGDDCNGTELRGTVRRRTTLMKTVRPDQGSQYSHSRPSH